MVSMYWPRGRKSTSDGKLIIISLIDEAAAFVSRAWLAKVQRERNIEMHNVVV